jgi:hypothetical protein
MSSTIHPTSVLAACLAALALSACTQSSAPPSAAAGPTASLARPATPPAQGGGCAGEIARTRAIVDADIASGNAGKSVGSRFTADLDQAQTACSAGRDADATRMVQAAKSRYGYNR